jgi:hypothetical protein
MYFGSGKCTVVAAYKIPISPNVSGKPNWNYWTNLYRNRRHSIWYTPVIVHRMQLQIWNSKRPFVCPSSCRVPVRNKIITCISQCKLILRKILFQIGAYCRLMWQCIVSTTVWGLDRISRRYSRIPTQICQVRQKQVTRRKIGEYGGAQSVRSLTSIVAQTLECIARIRAETHRKSDSALLTSTRCSDACVQSKLNWWIQPVCLSDCPLERQLAASNHRWK